MYKMLAGASYAPHILSLLRIVAGGSFFTHGTMKIFSWPAPFEHQMSSLIYIAGLMEVVGGFMLAIGLVTRPVAFVLSGLMAFAYFMAHAQQNFFPVLNGGEPSVLYCFLFLYIAAVGPGSWSVEGLLASRASPRAA
ncbi:DoxX family protein [Pelagibacterium sp. H642]|uniref:DoxX family protein n=1 Tax=Pelagibacterium sp. H642 TaxID=1881069 RepID=UPI002814F962|nr:DoxX family protein [Pelagibacterium sp. H642]WMT91919.1 DoxX family protein [Pelagibacterium sp. H642]